MSLKVALAAAVATLVAAAPASAVNYQTNTVVYTGLGDTIGSPFDQITLGGVLGSASGPGTYLVNAVNFLVGINSNTGGTYTGTFTDSATVGSTPYSYTVPYTINIDSSDTITIGGNSFITGRYKVTFNKLTLTSGVGSIGGNLYATVVGVPEPAAWALMIGGFGLVGGAIRRRKTRTVAAFA